MSGITVTMPIEEYEALKAKAGENNEVSRLADGINHIKECLSEAVLSKSPDHGCLDDIYYLKVKLNPTKFKVLNEAGLLPKGVIER